MRTGFLVCAVALAASTASGYIHAPPTTLKKMCDDSSSIRALTVKACDEGKGVVTFEAGETLRKPKADARIASFRLAVRPDAPGGKRMLAAMAVGQRAVLFTREHGTGKEVVAYGYALIDAGWYFVDYNADSDYWLFVRAEPQLSECYHGTAKELAGLVKAVLGGKKVEVPTRAPPKETDQRDRALLVDEAMRKNRPTYLKTPLPTAWGKPANGVQAGLRINPAVPYPGAVMVLEVVIRNVGPEPVEFTHLQLDFTGGGAGGAVTVSGAEIAGGNGVRCSVLVSPGDAYALARLPVFPPGAKPGRSRSGLPLRVGEHQVGAEKVAVQEAGRKDVHLATGHLDVRIPPKK